jgi:hypothetical protein
MFVSFPSRLQPFLAVLSFTFLVASSSPAQDQPAGQPAAPPAADAPPARESLTLQFKGQRKVTKQQAELDAKFAKSLSGATLEGSYTLSGTDNTKLRQEKYTLGEVKKLPEMGENVWLFPARIQYGEHDVTLPIPLPVEWAGDTPVIVVENVMLPGFGTVSARVLFFDGHYSGYWKHGDHSGNLFGTYRQAGEKVPDAQPAKNGAKGGAPQSGREPADVEQPNK